jgi:micrococcal nuclease
MSTRPAVIFPPQCHDTVAPIKRYTSLMATIRILFVLASVLCGAIAVPDAATAQMPDALQSGGTAQVIAVIDGDTVILDDAREVRLVGIQAPKLPLGRAGFSKWPLADEAKTALEGLVLGKRVSLGYGGRSVDRHDRLLAHLFTEDGTWVQAALLTAGFARVYSFPDNRALVREMQVRERRAQAAVRGIWAHPYYAVLDPAASARHLDQFALVVGRVSDVAVVKGRTFLNYGSDWRSDFTISIAPRDWFRFNEAGISPDDYLGRRIRVRGWLKSRNGPMIDVTHPEQIEVLSK